MTAELEVKARQGVNGYSGRKWFFFCWEEGGVSREIQKEGDPYAVRVWCILCIMVVFLSVYTAPVDRSSAGTQKMF